MSTATEQYDLADQRFWDRRPGERLEYFRYLRDERPVSWHGGADGLPGFWALVRYADVRSASRDPGMFSSAHELIIIKKLPGAEAYGSAMPSIVGMDDPEHDRVRGIVQKAFSAKQVKQLEDGIKADARRIVGELEPGETGNFVERVSKRLPSLTVSRMLGVPDDSRDEWLAHVDMIASAQDPLVNQGRDPQQILLESVIALGGHAHELAQHRRKHPGEADDLMSSLVEAEVDGHRLTDVEIATFMILLSFAGNDTTRNATSLGMKALTDFPEQRSWLMEDPANRLPVAVEELVRWSTPVMHFMRCATSDTAIGDHPIKKGQNIAMFYPSANRDERAFDDADRLDLSRDPNRHVGFGGGGPHFCLGAMLARAQLRALFGELLSTVPDMEVGEPEYITGNFINAVRMLPMDVGQRRD